MILDLGAELEARLKERPLDEGENLDLNETAQMMIQAYLDWEAQELAESVAAIKEGEKAFEEGRWSPLADVIARHRAKYGYPENWPHNVNTEKEDA